MMYLICVARRMIIRNSRRWRRATEDLSKCICMLTMMMMMMMML